MSLLDKHRVGVYRLSHTGGQYIRLWFEILIEPIVGFVHGVRGIYYYKKQPFGFSQREKDNEE